MKLKPEVLCQPNVPTPYSIEGKMKQSGWRMVYNGKAYRPENYVK